jgi:hypothetical protein
MADDCENNSTIFQSETVVDAEPQPTNAREKA